MKPEILKRSRPHTDSENKRGTSSMSEQKSNEQAQSSQELQQSDAEKDQETNSKKKAGESLSDTVEPGSAEQVITDKVGDTIENISGVDVSEEVKAFIAASKKLLDAIFSGVTGKIEQKINDYIKNLTK